MAFLVITDGGVERYPDATAAAKAVSPPWDWSGTRKQLADLMVGEEMLSFGKWTVVRLSNVVRTHKA